MPFGRSGVKWKEPPRSFGSMIKYKLVFEWFNELGELIEHSGARHEHLDEKYKVMISAMRALSKHQRLIRFWDLRR